MKTVVVDKIASITQACTLGHELRIADEIIAEEGVVVVAEILNNKSSYNTLELTSGRMAKVAKGDVVVGALAGTCMEAGKTAAAAAIVARMRHRGLVVDAFKATGVSLRRDIMAFEDAGARKTMIFTDLGIVTTSTRTGPALTRTMLSELAAGKPDVIVFELGDGLLGTYGVDAFLGCSDIRRALTGVVLSANDPVAAWGGVKLLRERFHIEPCMVTGPSTDNQVGIDIIEQQLKVPACNAISNPAPLGDAIIEAVGPGPRANVAAVSE